MEVSRSTLVAALPSLAALAVPAILFVVAGPVGAVAGGAALLVWYAAPVYGFAVGQFGLVAAMPNAAVSPTFLAAQAALFAFLALGLLRTRRSIDELVAFVVAAVALVVGVLFGLARGIETMLLAGGLVGVVAVGCYVLHRYELVVMGLTDGEA